MKEHQSKSQENNWNHTCLFLAVIMGLAALIVQRYLPDLTGKHRAEVLLRCEILSQGIPFNALLLETSKRDFQDEFGGELKLEDMPGDPSLFKATVFVEQEELAIARLERAESVLSTTVKRLATKEVRQFQKNLKHVPLPKRDKPTNQKTQTPSDNLKPSIKAESRQELVRLSAEIPELESYIAGGHEPSWLAGRIDSSLYANSERQFEQAESELITLNEKYLPGNKLVVAQKKLVALAGSRLKQDKVHLAKLLLQSYKEDLSAIETETLHRISQNIKKLDRRQPEPQIDSSSSTQDPSEAWLEDLVLQLKEDEAAIENAARVQQAGKVQFIKMDGSSKWWWGLILWTTSGCFLLAAVFTPQSNPEAKTTPKRLSIPNAPPKSWSPNKKLQSTAGSDKGSINQPDDFMLQMLESIEKELKARPTRFLILGSAEADAHSSVAARLSRTVSAQKQPVRLVDFDFQEKTLSNRLGNAETVGVSDLISSGAPVDEFLASVAGTRIEFAPAGTKKFIVEDVSSDQMSSLLQPKKEGVLVIDASFSSPLHLVVQHVEAVICVTSAGQKWSNSEQEVLLAIREAELPIWGLLQGDQQLYPFS